MGLRLLSPGGALGLGRVGESGKSCASQTWELVVVTIMYMMVSKKLPNWQDLNAYGIFGASKSYGNIGLRGMLVFGFSVASSFSEKRETHSFLELDQRGLLLYDCLSIPD